MPQSGFSEHLIAQESFARLGSLSWTYFEIAQAAYAAFLVDEAQTLPQPGPDDDPTLWIDQERRMTVVGIKTIVFAAMCVEAAAYDFSAIQFGDRYAAQYLDKLDLVSKWVVAPRLLSGKSLREHGPALNALRSLVRVRNRLVHSKSVAYGPETLAKTMRDNSQDPFSADVHNAFKVLVLLALEMKELLGFNCPGLPMFGKDIVRLPELATEVQHQVDRCHEIHQRNLDSAQPQSR
jgi:hypothetical protein